MPLVVRTRVETRVGILVPERRSPSGFIGLTNGPLTLHQAGRLDEGFRAPTSEPGFGAVVRYWGAWSERRVRQEPVPWSACCCRGVWLRLCVTSRSASSGNTPEQAVHSGKDFPVLLP